MKILDMFLARRYAFVADYNEDKTPIVKLGRIVRKYEKDSDYNSCTYYTIKTWFRTYEVPWWYVWDGRARNVKW